MISLLSSDILMYFTVNLPSEIMGTFFIARKNFGLLRVHNRSAVTLENRVISRLSYFTRGVKQQNVIPIS